MKLRPRNDFVLVTRQAAETQTASGIIIAEAAQETSQFAEVLAVGPGRFDELGDRLAMGVKVGDVVLLGKWAGSEIKLDGRPALLVREDDILAVVEEP